MIPLVKTAGRKTTIPQDGIETGKSLVVSTTTSDGVEKQQSRKTGLKPKLPWPSAKCTVTWVIPKPRRNKTIPQDGIRPLKRLHVLTLKRSNGLNDLARRDRETTASFPKENAARSPHSHGKIYTTPQD